MKKIIFILVAVLFFAACEKERFPQQKILIGTWVEKNGNNLKIVFTEKQMFLYVEDFIDTMNYSLNEEKEMLVLSQLETPDKISEIKMRYVKKLKELRIWNLLAGIPESENVIHFKKEE